MTNIAFLVDGDLEKAFISQSCKGHPIRKVGNGDKFPVHVLAKQVMTQVRLLSNRIHHFVLVLDLEDRDQTPEVFTSEVMTALQKEGLGEQSIKIFVKEREIEDWILADEQSLSGFIGTDVSTQGYHGKGGLKRLLKEHDIKYNEVAVGTDLIKSVYCSRAAIRSPSLAYFRKHFPGTCWWLER